MLNELLSTENIGFPLLSKSRGEMMEELVDLADMSGKISNKEAILKQVSEREEILSTTVGKGVFIPRAKSSHLSGLCLSFGVTSLPLDFGALDGNPVRFCIFLGIPETKIEEGIECLVRLFRLFNQDSFRGALLKAKTKKDVIRIFEEEERDLER